MNKKLAQRAHAKKRALERYGITANRRTLREWVETIQAGRATPIRKVSNRVSIFEIEHAGQPVRVVYDRERKTIVTCLPA